MPKPRISERTFYPPMIDIIHDKGGQGISEVQYNSAPDIVFELKNYSWILSVKIGEDAKTIKDGFLQYLRHKEESNKEFGMLLLLPEKVRKIRAQETDVKKAIANEKVTAFIDAKDVKEELRDRAFPEVIDFIKEEVMIRIQRQISSYYSFKSVIELLQEQVAEMMLQINLEEKSLLNIITDRKLLSDLGHLKKTQSEAVARFLGSYIFLSQVLFLRLLTQAITGIIPIQKPATHDSLREAFKKIRAINYRPIYNFDVLDSLDKKYLEDTFDLIWGLEIERVRYELPGRIFHELMPREIRKMLAAFYTRPQAADLLAKLTIEDSEDTVFDPACGSGTILTAAYRQKKHIFDQEGIGMNPHKTFCENDIFGADIMPFAVHLTSANLAAMDPAQIIERTQIIQGDSLRLKHAAYTPGIQQTLFPLSAKAKTNDDRDYEVELKSVYVVLMNPPFTKTERGIRKFVDMETFKGKCGGEVGLWGHFVILANAFLKDGGVYGAVIPINVIRGRESSLVRKFIFEEWSPLYIIKPTFNYGFSEWSEYRDILLIARKEKPKKDHKVKFCLVKKDLTKITGEEIRVISELIKNKKKIRMDELVDIDTYNLPEVKERFKNMMWFCGSTGFKKRDILVKFIESFSSKLSRLPEDQVYFRTGFRPDRGYSKFLYFTRATCIERVEQAFLMFSKETKHKIFAKTQLGSLYNIDKEYVVPSLRTPVGIKTMDLKKKHDYIAKSKYKGLKRVCRASGVEEPGNKFWELLPRKHKSVQTNLVICHRINPFSPSHHHIAFFSNDIIAPSDQMNIICGEKRKDILRAMCVVMNSVFFLSQFYLLKEESTGRFINIRVYDLEEMFLIPQESDVKKLARVFEKYSNIPFVSLREQFDENFEQRYKEFWEKNRGNEQPRLFSVLDKEIEPSAERIKFDLEVCKAIGLKITKRDLIRIYRVFVEEMIIIRGLIRD